MQKHADETMGGRPQIARSGADLLLGTLVRRAGASAIFYDASDTCIWAENLPSGLDEGCEHDLDSHLVPEDTDGPTLADARRGALDEAVPSHLACRHSGGRSFDAHVDPMPVPLPGAAKGGVLVTLVETTAQRRREQTLRTLLREVSHRSKNLLAIIQSVATQTGRYSGSIDNFLERFRGRIQSLAASQDLVTLSNWDGARLQDLVLDQVRRYCDPAAGAPVVEGIDPYLNPNAALHVGLALHELAVNSASYGALGAPGGSVRIMCRQKDAGALEIVWEETIPTQPDERADQAARFGRLALEKVVPAAVAGHAALQMRPGHLHYSLILPAENYRQPK